MNTYHHIRSLSFYLGMLACFAVFFFDIAGLAHADAVAEDMPPSMSHRQNFDEVWYGITGFLLLAVAFLGYRLWRTQAALHESEQRFWQVLEHLPLMVSIHRDGVIHYLNPFALHLINKPLQEVKGKPIQDFLLPQDAKKLEPEIAEIMQSGQGRFGESVHYVTPDGSRKHHDMVVSRTRIAIEGKPYILAIALDISDQNQMIRELKQQHHMLDVILSSSPVGIWMRDANGKLQFVNQAYANMIGVDQAALLAAEDDYALVDEDAAHIRKSSDMICKTSGKLHRSSEFYVTRSGEEVICEVIKVPLLDEAGAYQGLVGFSLDVTKRVQAEIEKSEIQKKALEAQHLESLGVLSGGIAHDFNNLLAVIMGNANLMRKRLDKQSQGYIFMQRIEQTCQKAANLCQQMLTYAGKSVLSSKPIQLSTLVHDMGSLLEVSLSKHVQIQYDLALDMPYFEGDEVQIQQVVMNLITNANEAMQTKGGSIFLRTCALDESSLAEAMDGLRVCAGSLQAQAYICLEVQDQGCGMDAATQQRIFEPFFTTKFTGRGLGMSAMLGIVQSHDGVIAMRSEVEQGTVFRVFFPVAEGYQQLVQASNQTVAVQSHAERRGKVLIVDDEQVLLETAQAMLQDLGYDTLLAEDGEQAVAIYRARQSEIQTVLLDMTMPKMDGKACAKALLAINPELKIIIASGYAEDDVYKQFKGLKLAGFIQKPYDFERLQDVMF